MDRNQELFLTQVSLACESARGNCQQAHLLSGRSTVAHDPCNTHNCPVMRAAIEQARPNESVLDMQKRAYKEAGDYGM